MPLIWDYNKSQLKKSKKGKLLLLERLINFGPRSNEKIKLSQVKKEWNKLHLFTNKRRLMELLLWGKPQS